MTEKSLSIVGASRNHGERDKYDFYPTPAFVTEKLLEREHFDLTSSIWEPACGEGDISEVLKSQGFLNVRSTDIVDRGYGETSDFFFTEYQCNNIITNPPFNKALEFIERAKLTCDGKIAMFLKTVFLESEARYQMFQDKNFPLKAVYQFSKRVSLCKGGNKLKNSGMIAYAWFVWDKNHIGSPTIHWIL